MALANFAPHVSQEAACIAGLGTCQLVSWPNSSSEEEDEQEDEEEEHVEQEEAGSELPLGGAELEQGETGQETKPRRRRQSWEWGSIMDEEEPLTFDDLRSDSDITAGCCSPVRLTPQELGSPRETAVEVHARESEVEAL